MHRRLQPVEELGAGGGGRTHAGREGGGEVDAEAVGENRAEDRDADRAAHLTEQRRAGGGHAEQLVRDGVLGRQDEHLHGLPSPKPSSTIRSAACQVGIPTLIRESRSIATVIRAVPAIGNGS